MLSSFSCKSVVIVYGLIDILCEYGQDLTQAQSCCAPVSCAPLWHSIWAGQGQSRELILSCITISHCLGTSLT